MVDSTKYWTAQGNLYNFNLFRKRFKLRHLLIIILFNQVDLPNHTVNRRSIRDMTHKETVEKVNLLTEFVMSQIDDFHQKYL